MQLTDCRGWLLAPPVLFELSQVRFSTKDLQFLSTIFIFFFNPSMQLLK
jgi:hypothetical protein